MQTAKPSNRLWIKALTVFFFTVAFSRAGPEYAPEWADQPGATRAYYEFATDDPMPEPTFYGNPYGAPGALILPDELFGTGWQDPEDPLDLVRVPDHGTWDLGKEGTMEFNVPIFAAAGETQVFVYLIAYEGITSLPSVSIAGHEPRDVVQTDTYLSQDPPGQWWSRSWSATVDHDPTVDHLSFVITGAPNGSVVDIVDMHVIPEPAALLLLLFGMLFRVQTRRGSKRTSGRHM